MVSPAAGAAQCPVFVENTRAIIVFFGGVVEGVGVQPLGIAAYRADSFHFHEPLFSFLGHTKPPFARQQWANSSVSAMTLNGIYVIGVDPLPSQKNFPWVI